jgi:hypothetical protein
MKHEQVWTTVQFFVSLTGGISEVQLDGTGNIRCSCKGFNSRSRCAHISKVGPSPENTVLRSAPKEELVDPYLDPEGFRNLVIRYGKPKVG